MSTGHPLGDFMWELLSPCTDSGQLVYTNEAIAKLYARFVKEAHDPEANAKGAVVLTAIGFLANSGQKKASDQLTKVLVEVVEAAQSGAEEGHFDEFLGAAKSTVAEFAKAPPKGAKKAKDFIPIPRTFGR